jgi:GMP synthase-like glutamine amidotransferase
MRILCLKHIAFEGPAMIASWAQQHGHSLDVHLASSQPPLPSMESFDLLLIMGGPMNAYEDERYPWLSREKSYIRSAIARKKLVIGICLGAQLIAHTLGAKVKTAPHKEIGWFPIQRSPNCPPQFELPDNLSVFHWHGDQFEIPTGALPIASSEACANQGFLYSKHVLALQCHLEVTAQSVALLTAACSNELVSGRYIQSAENIQSAPTTDYDAMHAILFQWLDRFAAGGDTHSTA